METLKTLFVAGIAFISALSSLPFCGGSSDKPQDAQETADVPEAQEFETGDLCDSGCADATLEITDTHEVEVSGLPFEFTRPENGEAVSGEELAEITSKYIELLKGTRYFDFVYERAHGWPETDPENRYWFGTWWSGVKVSKKEGKVTYLHSADGADNNGIRTPPFFEGACFAYKLSKKQTYEKVLRKLLRGMNAWIMAMEREENPPGIVMLTRAFYPKSIVSNDHEMELFIDYSLNRPGKDNSATEYVHNPTNPYWGDIWVKNKRSKDDIGHMFRGIAQMDTCKDLFSGGLKEDYDKMIELYSAWARQVEKDGWAISTYDKEGNLWIPPDGLAHFFDSFNVECTIIISLRLLGAGDPGEWDCGNGISEIDELATVKPSNAQMQRSFHESAVLHTLRTGYFSMAKLLLQGLAIRVETTLDKLLSDDPPEHPIPVDMAELILQSANVGVPLTWREVRYLHDRIKEAHEHFLNPAMKSNYNLFKPETPDGDYPYNPGDYSGLKFRDIGLVIGTCAAKYLNPASKPVVDCKKLADSL